MTGRKENNLMPVWQNFSERGSITLFALIVVAIAGVLGGAYYSLSRTEHTIAMEFSDGIAAQYLAESGVQHALVRLKTDPAFAAATETLLVSTANTLTYTDTTGLYKAIITGNSGRRTITAVGTAGKAKRQLVVTVSLIVRESGAAPEVILLTWKNQN